MVFAIKAEVHDPQAKSFAFNAQKTMYGRTLIAEGDAVFMFASENDGGYGPIARGVPPRVFFGADWGDRHRSNE